MNKAFFSSSFKKFCAIAMIMGLGSPHLAASASERPSKIRKLEFVGLVKTQENWLRGWLGIDDLRSITLQNLDDLRWRLLTSQAFSSVEISKSEPRPGVVDILITVDEKWTTIPVIRGEFGGGTPLKVFGLYDTHSFGRLWTLGGEFRQYGSAKPGWVVYASQPRWIDGRYSLKVEYWSMQRNRQLYTSNYKQNGTAHITWSRLRAQTTAPLTGLLQAGVEFVSHREEPTRFDGLKEDPRIKPLQTAQRSYSLGPVLHYDSIKLNNSDADGHRLLLKWAYNKEGSSEGDLSSLQAFSYWLPHPMWNFALHTKIAQSSSESPESLFYLGGLDSVRGIPDGLLVGNRVGWVNFETRFVGIKYPNAWVQIVGFADWGTAGFSRKEQAQGRGFGGGFRISYPKVHRMMLRLDIARSSDNSTWSLSAGLNQFFQPYKPL